MTPFDLLKLALPAAALLLAGHAPVAAADRGIPIRAKLVGFEEVAVPDNPTAPGSLFSLGSGRFVGRVTGDSIRFILSYEGLEAVQQAHIHFGQRRTNGGVVVFLCTNSTPPLPPVPAPQPCPPQGGTVEGTLTAADVVGGASAQGIEAGEFDKVVESILEGYAYANVHTEAHPSGELRGQIRPGRRFGH